MGQTVNLLAQPSMVRIHHSPLSGLIIFYRHIKSNQLNYDLCQKYGVVDSNGQVRRPMGGRGAMGPQPSRITAKVPLLMAPKGLDRGPEARSRMLRAGGRIHHSPLSGLIIF